MIESNDLPRQDIAARNRRRKSAGWKSGLLLTGLGAVVLGAGYLAGVNAPAVGQSSTAPAAARAERPSPNSLGDQPLAPSGSLGSGQGFQFNDDATLGVQSQGDDGASTTFNQQLEGRRSRQLRSLGQQQPNFSRPLTRSRGS